MPERLNLASLLEITDDKGARLELIRRIKEIFSDWIGDTAELVLMDCDSAGRMVKWTFPDAIPNLERGLSATDILFVYFNGGKTGSSILSISKNHTAYLYTISFPNLEMLARRDDLFRLLVRLYLEISSMGIHCVVVVGGELEMGKAFQSVDGVIQAASNWDSLVEYLCCDKNDAPQSPEFVSLTRAVGVQYSNDVVAKAIGNSIRCRDTSLRSNWVEPH